MHVLFMCVIVGLGAVCFGNRKLFNKNRIYYYHMLCMLMLEVIFLHCGYSVRSPREDEWILDPVIIADIYGPEVLHLFLLKFNILNNFTVHYFVSFSIFILA